MTAPDFEAQLTALLLSGKLYGGIPSIQFRVEKGEGENRMTDCGFKQIDQTAAVKATLASLDPADNPSGPKSSGSSGLRIFVATENGKVLCLSVPITTGQGQPGGGYGPDQWGGAASEDRSSNYHDPVQPGTANPATGCVWVQDKGYVPADQVPPGSIPASAAAHFRAVVGQATADFLAATKG